MSQPNSTTTDAIKEALRLLQFGSALDVPAAIGVLTQSLELVDEKAVRRDERQACCTYLLELHKQYGKYHNYYHVAAVNLWEKEL